MTDTEQPTEQPTELNEGLQDVSLDDSPPTRSIAIPNPLNSSTHEPSHFNSEQPSNTLQTHMNQGGTDMEAGGREDSEQVGQEVSTQTEGDATWTEPEVGFEQVELGHHHHPSTSSHNNLSSTSSFQSNSSATTKTATTTTTTTTTPSSPTRTRSDPLSSTTNTTVESSSIEKGPEGEQPSGMSKPPDLTKVEQPNSTTTTTSPTKSSRKSPSMMQKVVSMTRQRDLPPKSKEEEEKHLRELSDMLAASKEAEKRRRQEEETKAQQRAAALASALPTWETSILPNWRSVLTDTSEGRQLRRLWWQGTMPVRFRGRLWSLCIGNGLAVSKSAFGNAVSKAKRLIEEEDREMLSAREEARVDTERTLPTLKLFQRDGGVMHEDLMDLLLAFSVHEQRKPRYPRGLAYPASLLLVNMSPPDAFISLVNLVSKSFLRSFYSVNPDEMRSYERVFDTLLADTMPKVYANFMTHSVRPHLYLFPWLSTLFVHFLPIDLSTRLFDVFLLEGDSFCFQVALVLLQILEPRLFNPNLEELAKVFEGKDQGAVAIVKREKGLLNLPTTTTTGTRSEQQVDDEEEEGGTGIGGVQVEDVYTEMGCREERIFELLDRMEWKEETWERLVERELPEAD